ncbi:MAG: hypothetical protein ABIG89_03160 [Candidatus Woesearchaeota archaeon]
MIKIIPKNKRGFAFLLDIMISIAIVFTVLGVANLYMTPKADNQPTNMNMLDRAFDTIILLEKEGELGITDFSADTRYKIIQWLNSEYDMYITKTSYNKEGVEDASYILSTISPAQIPEDKNEVLGNEYHITNYRGNEIKFFKIEYYIWKK